MNGSHPGPLSSVFRAYRQTMWQIVVINSLCLLIALAALGVAVWTVVAGQIQEQGIDALFLVLVCLVIAFAFSLTPARAIREGLLKELVSRYKARAIARTEPQAKAADQPSERDKAAS